MNDAIDHPEAAQLVDSLVASGGGHVAYEFGAPADRSRSPQERTWPPAQACH